MQHRNQHIVEAWIAAVLAVILSMCVIHKAMGQDTPAEHPAFGPHQISTLSVESNVPDIAKLEVKAVDVLRTKYGLSLVEARAKVRVDGKTDVARCLEYLIINAVGGITQAQIIVTVVGNQHPEAAQ